MMETTLFNPYKYLAGIKACLLGTVVILLTSIIAWSSGTHFDGIIDVHAGLKAKYSVFLTEGFVNWVITVFIFYILGVLFSKSKIRFIDVLGTFSLARYPLLISAMIGFIPLANMYNPYSISPTLVSISLLAILVNAWMIALLYNAYSISCNIKGYRLIISFIAGIFIAELISKIVLSWIYLHI